MITLKLFFNIEIISSVHKSTRAREIVLGFMIFIDLKCIFIFDFKRRRVVVFYLGYRCNVHHSGRGHPRENINHFSIFDEKRSRHAKFYIDNYIHTYIVIQPITLEDRLKISQKNSWLLFYYGSSREKKIR